VINFIAADGGTTPLTTFTAVNGWTVTTDAAGHEHYLRKHDAVEVVAVWDPAEQSGTISVRSTYHGFTRFHADTAEAIRDPAAFWIAANLAADTAAAPLPVLETMEGDPEVTEDAVPLEANFTFTTTTGRIVAVTVTDEQASNVETGFYKIEKYVWSEQRDDHSTGEGDQEPEQDASGVDTEPAIPAGEPSTADALKTMLEARFGLPAHELVVRGDWQVFFIIGEERMRPLMEREDELVTAMGRYWRHEHGRFAAHPCIVIRR
jgi:hypothetical protein